MSRGGGTSVDVNEQRQHLRDFSAVEEIAVLIVLGLVSVEPTGSVNHMGFTDEGFTHAAAGRAPLILEPPDYRVQHIPVG